MAFWTSLKTAVAAVIKQNGSREITGDVLQSVLLSITDQIGENATFVGVAIPETIPNIFDGPVFYIASEPGIYSGFDNYDHSGARLVILKNNTSGGAWTAIETEIVTVSFQYSFVPLADRVATNIAGGEVNDFTDNPYVFGVNPDGNFMAGNPGDLNRLAFMKPVPTLDGGIAFWNNSENYIDISSNIIVNSTGIGFGKTPARPLDLLWSYEEFKSHIAISGGGNYVNIIQNMYGSSPTFIGVGLQASITSGNYPVYSINTIRKGSSTITVPVLYFDARVDSGMPGGQLVTRFAKNYYGSADSNYLVDIYEDGRLETLGGLKNRGVFVDGFGGQGWCVTPNGTATFENLTVRGSMWVYHLEVKKIDFRGGTDVISDGGVVKFVADEGSPNTKYIYFDNKNGVFGSPFRVNNIVRTQNFTGDSVKFWEGIVLAYVNDVTYNGEHCYRITVHSDHFATTSPLPGESVVRMGDTSDPNYQSFILLTSAENNSPYIRFVTGRNAIGSSGTTMCQIGNLASINDPEFGGVINDSGLYAKSVYLKGKIIVTGGNAATQDYADSAAGAAETNANAYTDALEGSLGDLAYDDLIGFAKLDTTIVEGGYIKTSLLDVDAIIVGLASESYVNSSIGDIKIGAINLISGSNVEITCPLDDLTKNTNAAIIKEGEQYTISFYIKSGVGYTGNTALLQGYSNEDATTRVWISWVTATTITEYTRVIYTFTVPTGLSIIRFRLGLRSSGGQVNTYTKWQLETGNKATDWSLNYEDAQNYADAAAYAAETNAINQAETLANQAEADANTYSTSIVNTLSASLGDLAYEDLVEDAKLGTSILIGGLIKTSLIDATWIQTSVINTTYIEGLALNFTQGKIGDFQIMQNSIGHEIDGTKFVTLANQTDSNVIVNTYDSGGRLGLNIYRYNAAIGTDGLKLSRFGQITDLDTHNIWGATPQFGVQIQYRKDSVNKDIFRVDDSGAMIAGASFTYEKIFTANWSLEADGTATFTKGSIGGFSINSDHLFGGTSGEDRFLLYPQSHLSFLSSDDERTFRIGQDTFPVFAGWEGLGLIENKRIESTYGNVGLYINAENAGGTGYSQNDRNIAVWVEHGDIKTKEGNMRAYKDWYLKDMDDVNWTLKVGLSLKFLIRQIGTSDPNLYLPNLATINAAIGTPDSGNYQFSVAIKCHRSTNRTIYIHPAAGVSMYNFNGGTESTYTMQNGDYFEFVFDGAAWNATVKFT
jgi:hypothetical protein